MNGTARTQGTVRIVGTGLLGASIGHALTALGVDVALFDAAPTQLQLAIDYGAGRAVRADDAPSLVVVAVPPDVTADVIERELVLIKLSANATNRNDIMHVVNTFRGKIVDVSPETMTIEVTGSEGKIDAMLELLKPFDLREVVRTGQIAMARRHELKAPSKKAAGKSRSKKASGKK